MADSVWYIQPRLKMPQSSPEPRIYPRFGAFARSRRLEAQLKHAARPSPESEDSALDGEAIDEEAPVRPLAKESELAPPANLSIRLANAPQ